MVEVRLVIQLTRVFASAVRVRDDSRAERGGAINRGGEIRERVRPRLDEKDLAIRANGAGHVEIE